MEQKYLAQVNIAKMREPLNSVVMKELFDFLEPVNKLADESAGFIWRLQDEDGGSSAHIASPFEDDMMIINISVWEDLESLKDFVYNTVHGHFVRNGRKWFEKIDIPQVAMWWVDANHTPTIDEAIERLKLVENNGPTPDAFNMKEVFDMEGGRYSWKR